eukprot:TRINITY_DN740_c0_g2_i2.p1 TRINITY_DN740_c0_g2~~TRINITY_DN740_c0_g2_i2.p1  ORF type:complete len:539 (-),score=109.07 TRINITY_DN740_c0_g2_i2:224-1840(-)
MSGIMEIETPCSLQAQEPRGVCFPISCGCCPGSVRMLVPAGWMKIQDCTHMTLLGGVASGIALVVIQGVQILKFQFCFRLVLECILVVFISPCTIYFTTIIQQYDDRLQEKQKQRQEKKEMDGLLTKSTESTAGLAERSFESKRRDFQRFLERAKSRFADCSGEPKTSSSQLLAQFRRFCFNWLHVFEECSIDPVHAPKKVVSQEELNRCTNIPEICDLCLEKLRVTEVRFISMQRDQDAQMLRKNRNTLRLLSGSQGQRSHSPRTAREAMLEHSDSHKLSWVSCGSMRGCRIARSELSEDGYPKDVCLLCAQLMILSREHGALLMAWFVGMMIFTAELVYQILELTDANRDPFKENLEEDNVVYVSLVLQMLTQVAIIMVLYKFEELDVIQQLDREVKELKENTENVLKQQKEMHDFWSNAQQLSDLWLYRTVPRLELYKEVHSQLEDASNEDLLVKICGANQCLEDVDHRLGDLEAWRLGGKLSLDNKKQFAKTINAICAESEFDEILRMMEDASHGGLKCLEVSSISMDPGEGAV